MYKFLVLGVVLSLQLSDIMGMMIMDDFRMPEPIEIDKSFDDYDYTEQHDVMLIPNIPKSTEDKPEDKPKPQPEDKPHDKPNDKAEDKPEDKSKDLGNSLDNLVEKLGDLVKVAVRNGPTQSSTTNIVKELSSEYLVTKGIGAHKLHLRRLSWNKARKVCIDEGGQLADIRSDSEEKIILQMLVEEDVEFAWVGYHDIFEEGDWVSVLGEPLGKSGWDRWWKKRLPNPDNVGGEEDCACLMRDGGGMNDNNCSKELPFVCKITAL